MHQINSILIKNILYALNNSIQHNSTLCALKNSIQHNSTQYALNNSIQHNRTLYALNNSIQHKQHSISTKQFNTTKHHSVIIIIGIQPLGRSGQRPESIQTTGMALERCILGKFLGVACHCFPPLFRRSDFSPPDASTSATT